MFERIYKSGMILGPRILFFGALVMLIAAFVPVLFGIHFYMMSFQRGPSIDAITLFSSFRSVFYSNLVPAGYLFCGAFLVERADRIIEHLRS
ncbi:hypothetical protein [Chelativorans sp. M5D2P16]|uniref:hypothetical protein n=1 Tax=Chelativorans sp. M5D2P16 TaxID=3095678 RepID=UPI002ACA07FA|nr:hypothetical protein [Chelativorans sp. M5D2P16]MDZ5699383.1 hypothetical protein [Chelativorans sp. M5D2P16]